MWKISLLAALFALLFTWTTRGTDELSPSASGGTDPVRVRMTPMTNEDVEVLEQLEAYHVSEIPPDEIGRTYEFMMPAERAAALETGGLIHEILPAQLDNWNDEDYYSYKEVHDALLLHSTLYPDIASMVELGYSTRDSVTLWAIKISDNVTEQENEPDVLIDGVIHAREPMGAGICMAIIDSLLYGYGRRPEITTLVDETEIWVIPILNSEGYLYVETGILNPWWRKNKRDNNHNGVFDATEWVPCEDFYFSMMDGVDMNRNYAEGWEDAGSPDSCSIIYRGPEAFSENETGLHRDLVAGERPAAAVSFHSYSEYVGYCGQDAAGYELCSDMAQSILREDGLGPYACDTFYGAGQSYNWMYWDYGVQAFLVETATEFFPSGADRIKAIVDANVNGIMTVLGRVHGSSIRGTVVDASSGQPLEAEVEVAGEVPINLPRTSEPHHGRFYRMVVPGTYTVRVSRDDYHDYEESGVVVEEGLPTVLEIELESSATGVEDGEPASPPGARVFAVSQNFPNPFNPSTTIGFTVPPTGEGERVAVTVHVFDVRGRLVRTLLDGKRPAGSHRIHWDGRGNRGEPVPSGVYFYRVTAADAEATRKMTLAR